ncbi:YDG/SRA domain-containing protein [Hymenobacter chitinivorans]|uniref:SAD/SRA domain-containing protein n=1 Tax=Hymenobacter chitinivorans DSM 11115 TaxID=1121954 RepID=A0A2M9BAM1_9BACT|nr:YDG/SRA domain-containing protein [Hymenobacter chitinivorans]PJJ54996.1 SAD/SRA domain-containing protein [Hymenobacter chitinivorans DSM 11115]
MRIFGHVGTYRPGDTFASRLVLSAAGVHRPLRAGVSGTPAEGVDSIVLAGQYEDDVFGEDQILYAGHGGRDPKTGHQTADQELTARNRAFHTSLATRRPVRVLQKVPAGDETLVYRYEGLYQVTAAQYVRGRSGYYIWLFTLRPALAEA